MAPYHESYGRMAPGEMPNGSPTNTDSAANTKTVPAKMPTAESPGPPVTPQGDDHIIDIRRGTIQHSIRDDMMEMLKPAAGEEKKMPTLLLYDEAGLKLFEDITYLDEYYLTNAEIEVLTKNALEMAQFIRPGSMLVELGSGYDYRPFQTAPAPSPPAS